MPLSNGKHFLDIVANACEQSRNQGKTVLKNHSVEIEEIGACLNALYLVSTCADGCTGGDHLHEYLAGRCYNLGTAAFLLIETGLYDESLNHVRSLGEIANLQSLFLSNAEFERNWRASSLRDRLRRFGPAAVRKKIKELGSPLPMDADTYSYLCEQATHVTPGTQPNNHTADDRPRVGPQQQELGAIKAIEHLSNMLVYTALWFTRYTDNDDLFKELESVLIDQAEKTGS